MNPMTDEQAREVAVKALVEVCQNGTMKDKMEAARSLLMYCPAARVDDDGSKPGCCPGGE